MQWFANAIKSIQYMKAESQCADLWNYDCINTMTNGWFHDASEIHMHWFLYETKTTKYVQHLNAYFSLISLKHLSRYFHSCDSTSCPNIVSIPLLFLRAIEISIVKWSQTCSELIFPLSRPLPSVAIRCVRQKYLQILPLSLLMAEL